MTVEYCRDLCYERSKAVFGVENGNQCWCGDEIPDVEPLAADECSVLCSGNEEGVLEYCGGFEKINIFLVNKNCLSSNAKYDPLCVDDSRDPHGGLGCNADDVLGCRLCGFDEYPKCPDFPPKEDSKSTCFQDYEDNPILPDFIEESDEMTVEYCRDLCYERSKAVFGVENGNQCWCGDEIPDVEPLAADECSVLCSGNEEGVLEYCGGFEKINIFLVNKNCLSSNAKYDPLCVDDSRDPHGGLGCNADGVVGCRFCGFDEYPECPEFPPPKCDKQDGECSANVSKPIVRGPRAMGFARAKHFCKSKNSVLPRPRNNAENRNLANRFGPTWVNVVVNAILDKDPSYAHWERRLRGYLNGDEQWSIIPAAEERIFYCLKQEEQNSSCGSQLRGIIDDTHWSYADRKSSYFSKLTEAKLDRLDWGSKVRVVCPARRPARNFFICVRNPSGGQFLAKCRNRSCGVFTRVPEDMNKYICIE